MACCWNKIFNLGEFREVEHEQLKPEIAKILGHDLFEIAPMDIKAPMAVHISSSAVCSFGYHPEYAAYEQMLWHEVGHFLINPIIYRSMQKIWRGPSHDHFWKTFRANAEFQAQKYAIENLARQGRWTTLRYLILGMYFDTLVDPIMYPAHHTAFKRLKKSKNLKPILRKVLTRNDHARFWLWRGSKAVPVQRA